MLSRNVQIGRSSREIAHRLQEFVGHVGGIGAHEPHAANTGYLIDFHEQIGETGRLFALDVTVAVDRLTQQDDFDDALIRKRANLVEDIFRRTRLLRPANAWNDTVRAEFIAPEHNADHRLKDARTRFREPFRVEKTKRIANGVRIVLILEPIHADGDLLRAGRRRGRDKRREPIYLAGPANNIDVGRARKNLRLIFLRP